MKTRKARLVILRQATGPPVFEAGNEVYVLYFYEPIAKEHPAIRMNQRTLWVYMPLQGEK